MSAREGRLVVVGDALLDRDLEGAAQRLAPDAPVPVVGEPEEQVRPGGAALAAALAASDGRPVTFVTALGDDPAGGTLVALLDEFGVDVLDLGLHGRTPEKVRVRASGHALVRMDYGGGWQPIGALTQEARDVLAAADAVLVADYGNGMTAHDGVRSALAALPARVPIVWDPHPRGAAPIPDVRLATPNRAEAATFAAEVDGFDLSAVTARARSLRSAWRAAAVTVTLGAAGALMVDGDGPPLVVPARAVASGDPCGAGDRFAAAAAGLLADGALPSEAVTGAVAAAAAFVEAGGAACVPHLLARESRVESGSGRPSAVEIAQRVRAGGGTVVATGGCFDILHAGHVRTLQGARALGDCLIVVLNSDASVRRLKGRERPVVPQHDRAAILEALGCVDAVAVFDEDTPEQVLEQLEPHVFVKGGDYAVGELPETPVLARWGGQVVILPYVQGRSTTGILSEVVRRGGG